MPTISPDALLLTPRMLAERLGISHPTARKLMLDGDLPTVWVRTRAMVRVSDVEAFVASGGVKVDRAS